VERFVRDAKLLEIGGGTTEMQLRTIARGMIRDEISLNPLLSGTR
jgi:alkylation response protein AidB-like acyl-CoA dehydrogenase